MLVRRASSSLVMSPLGTTFKRLAEEVAPENQVVLMLLLTIVNRRSARVGCHSLGTVPRAL